MFLSHLDQLVSLAICNLVWFGFTDTHTHTHTRDIDQNPWLMRRQTLKPRFAGAKFGSRGIRPAPTSPGQILAGILSFSFVCHFVICCWPYKQQTNCTYRRYIHLLFELYVYVHIETHLLLHLHLDSSFTYTYTYACS